MYSLCIYSIGKHPRDISESAVKVIFAGSVDDVGTDLT
jgi:hypothetical protein